jgi:Tol biopolymer transport system component
MGTSRTEGRNIVFSKRWPGAVAIVLALCAAPAAGSRASEPSGEIVFASDRDWAQAGEVYVARVGASLIDVSNSPFADRSVAVSSRGEIAFWSNRHGRQELFETRADGSRLRPVAGSAVVSDQYPPLPVFSADGRTLTFSRAVSLGRGRYRNDVLRADAARAVAHRALSSCTQPDPSPYHPLVACHPGQGRIEVRDARGRRVLRAPGVVEAWSRAGLAVGSQRGTVTLYDLHGRPRHRYAGAFGAWSVDGRLLALGRGDRLVLQTVGGAARTVYAQKTFQAQGAGVSFTPDGRGLAFSGLKGLLLAGVSGGTPRRIEGYGGAWSPDGRHYASFRLGPPPYAPGVRLALTIGDRYGAHPVVVARVLFDDHGENRLVWLPDGSGVVYETSAETAGSDLYAVSADGTGLRRLTSDPRNQVDPSWSSDGRQLAYGQSDFTGHLCEGCSTTLWRADPELRNPVQLTSGPADGSFDSRPSWSPSGDALVYTHGTYDSGEIDLARLDGSPPTTVTKGFSRAAWSPDGTTLAVTDSHGVEGIAPTGGPARVLIQANAEDVAWSPDGRLLAITTERALLVAPADGSAPATTILAIAEPAHPSFSPDGRWIAFSAAAGTPGVWGGRQRDVMIVGVDGSGRRTVAASPFADVDPAWQPQIAR